MVVPLGRGLYIGMKSFQYIKDTPQQNPMSFLLQSCLQKGSSPWAVPLHHPRIDTLDFHYVESQHDSVWWLSSLGQKGIRDFSEVLL